MEMRNIKRNGEKDGGAGGLGRGYSNEGYRSDHGSLDEMAVSVDEIPPKGVDGIPTKVYISEPLEAEEAPNGCVSCVTTVTEGVGDVYTEHGTYIWRAIYCLLVVGYAIYFAFAMWYSFGDEGSIRLLWVTCLVVVCVIIYLIKHFFGESMAESCTPCTDWMTKHNETISWVVVGFVWLFVVIFVIVDVAVVSKSPYNLVSLAGIITYILLMYIFSYSPARVRWRPVVWGMALQFVFAMIILRWSVGQLAFEWLGERVTEFLNHTDAGSRFLFGNRLIDEFVFAFKVLSVVIFFSTIISILYYLGWMQVVIQKVAWVMQVSMGTTAAESLNAAGNIFIGQSEAPLLIRPLIQDMTRSELHAVMTGGFATIAGSVLGAYISFGVPANHLLSASVMSAPAALAIAKLFYPETEKSKTTADDVKVMEKSPAKNIVEAASSGASSSISLVANIGVNLIAFLAILNFLNETLRWFGERVGLIRPTIDFTFEFIMSYILYPFAIIMGVVPEDCLQVGRLMGLKTFLNEFVAYQDFGVLQKNRGFYLANCALNGTMEHIGNDIYVENSDFNKTLTNGILYSERSTVITTYALCGFANFGSIGVMIGALSAMAPHRRADLSSIAIRAMIAGNVACFMTACIAGLFYEESGVRLFPMECP